jgi:hypothetical protein
MSWPWTVERFLVPAIPWLASAVVIGVHGITGRIRPSWQKAVTLLVAGAIVADGLMTTRGLIRERQGCDRSDPLSAQSCFIPFYGRWVNYFSIVRHVRDHVEPGAVFLVPFPATLYLFTNHRAVPMPEAVTRSSSDFLRFARERNVTHIVLSRVAQYTEGKPRESGTPLAEMVRDNCQALRLEASAPPDAHLFRVTADEDVQSSNAACQAADDFVARFKGPQK